MMSTIYQRLVPWGERQALNAYRPGSPLRSIRTEPDGQGYCLSGYDQNRCIFVHIPKTAGISLCKTLFGSRGGGHHTARAYRAIFGRQAFEQYFKFTFVRNPWDRLVSAYAFLSKGGMNERDQAFGQSVLGRYPNFEDFVMRWLDEKNIYTQIHFVPQWEFVVDGWGRQCMDFVGRFERIDDDFRFIMAQLGRGGSLPMTNASKRSDYRDYYNTRTRRRVEDVYRRDVEEFEYLF